MFNIPQYFEEFEQGYVLETSARTLTEADVFGFAGIGGNFHPVHVDKLYANKMNFKNILAHGLLVVAIMEGLIERTGIIDKILVFSSIKELYFHSPVFPGDTLTGRVEVCSKNDHPGKDAGEIVLKMKAINQTGKAVAAGVFTILVMKKP